MDEPPDGWMTPRLEDELARRLDVESVDVTAGGPNAAMQRAVDDRIDAEIAPGAEQQIVDGSGARQIDRLVREPRAVTGGRHGVWLETDREHVTDARIREELLDDLDAERRGGPRDEDVHGLLRSARPRSIRLATASCVSAAAAASCLGSSAARTVYRWCSSIGRP